MYLTVAQTPVFQSHAAEIWRPEELDLFVNWIARNPVAGDVIPESGGLRKVRWSVSGRGKSGGARVIYYNLLNDGTVWLLMAYTKSKFDNLPVKFMKELKNAIPPKAADPDVAAFHRDLLESVRQMRAGKAARKTRVKVPDVARARQVSGLSQAQFADLLGISMRTLQKWEQGEREPSGAAKSLIRIAQKHPEVLADALD